MLGSFRARLIATVISLIAVTAAVVTIGAYVLVRNSLRGQLVDDAVARAEFNLTVLATTDQLPDGADRAGFEASGLADRFLFRGTGGVYVDFGGGEPYVSSLSLLPADELLSVDLRSIVAAGNFGYEFLTVDGRPSLVVGGRRPPAGPDFYFFDSAAEVENALGQLGRVLVVAGLVIVALGAVGAGLIARRVLRPVAVAGEAAGLMARGDLSVRLAAGPSDELGQLAVAFNQMAESLQEQMAALVAAHDRERQFVADVSHELRTPLTALVNEAARLRTRLDELPATDRRVGEMLVADVGRLSALVEDLLEVSRLDSVESAPEMSAVDLRRFLEAVIADRLPAASLQMSSPIESITTDRRSLERIVGNLLDNAAHHAPGAAVEVTVERTGEQIRIEVGDAGPGVPTEDLSRLFDRFFKTDAARGGGSGLGLSIARQHARRLGGDLSARPGEEGGLVFELRLPVTELLRSGDAAENPPAQSESAADTDYRSTS